MSDIIREVGEGSPGGKGRGLILMNSILRKYGMLDKYEGVKIVIPRTLVVATGYFDDFIGSNGLGQIIDSGLTDEQLLSRFVAAHLPGQLVYDLRAYIRYAGGPLAVRSSSMLEDAQYRPFAGVYSTYMIPLSHDREQTLDMLGNAVKSVYASVYFASSRDYMYASGNLPGEEKMGVIIQEVCGTEDDGYFFPTISGVARSLNFYPIGDEKPEEGIVNLAFGLGKLIVEGGQTLRFSPRHPKNILQLSTPEFALCDTQRDMYALNMQPGKFTTSVDDGVNIERLEINKHKEFRGLKYVASRWDAQNRWITDSSYEEGRRIITFNRILKYDTMPLAEIITDLLQIGERETGVPVELEFAVDMDVPYGEDVVFNLLQIRPIVDAQEGESLDWAEVSTADAIIYSESALGRGVIEGVTDIVYVRTGCFDSAATEKIADEIMAINNAVRETGGSYVLVGPGRWGSADPWLGIPVKWSQISEAKAIVEVGLEDFRVDPSQGTHFFQNLTSFGVGYMTISPFRGDGIFDEKCLDAMDALYESPLVRHVRFEESLYVCVDGRESRGIIKY